MSPGRKVWVARSLDQGTHDPLDRASNLLDALLRGHHGRSQPGTTASLHARRSDLGSMPVRSRCREGRVERQLSDTRIQANNDCLRGLSCHGRGKRSRPGTGVRCLPCKSCPQGKARSRKGWWTFRGTHSHPYTGLPACPEQADRRTDLLRSPCKRTGPSHRAEPRRFQEGKAFSKHCSIAYRSTSLGDTAVLHELPGRTANPHYKAHRWSSQPLSGRTPLHTESADLSRNGNQQGSGLPPPRVLDSLWWPRPCRRSLWNTRHRISCRRQNPWSRM